ncbi:hypothetical protein EDD22DRAFT_1003996 [Suillus occidentalis]|nr:hypothetical protein EDD22DRAFT_1003996 [Suillus occidentalis]
MTFVSNWPYIDSQVFFNYWIVVAGVVVAYDWALTVGQEIELIWRQRWSLMTVLYLLVRTSYYTVTWLAVVLTRKCARYAILEYLILLNMPGVSLTDAVCDILLYARIWIIVVIIDMLGVIMIARLHAMYQRSRTMLIFLVIIFLALVIACVVLAVIALKQLIGQTPEEQIISGVHMCSYGYEGDSSFLFSMAWILATVWEVFALCLSVWIAAKHFRDLRRLGPSTGSTIWDCLSMLVQSHVLYFASFAGVSCFQFITLSSAFLNSSPMGVQILFGILQVSIIVQMFVLGPRLILSVREYHAKLVAGSNANTSMNSIVFQEHVHISTSGTV